MFGGHAGKGSSAVRVKGPLSSSPEDSHAGVFDPMRSHPTVALLISDLKGGGLSVEYIASGASLVRPLPFFSCSPLSPRNKNTRKEHAQLCIFI